MRLGAILVAFALLALAPACLQPKGDVCQVNSDCEGALVCNAPTQTCQPRGSGGDTSDASLSDAALPFDGPPEPDAAPVEADAAPEADAAAAM